MSVLRSRALVLVVFTVFTAVACRNPKQGPLGMSDPSTPTVTPPPSVGLELRLSNADADRGGATRPPLAAATVLDTATTDAVLARLPKLPSSPGDEQDFALREGSKPPPKTGATVLASFPPKPTAAAPKPKVEGAPTVLRHAPDGEVPIVPQVSVSFDQPMVPITSIDALAARDVPVTLTPQPPGKWRWVGAKTLVFEPDAERLPMATTYEVAIPKGIRSATGGTLAKGSRFAFATPAPVVKNVWPQHDAVPRQPVIFVEFDQAVSPAAVAKHISLTSGRARDIGVRVARADEIAADETVRALSQQAHEGRWVAVVPNVALPGDSRVRLSIGPGTPSAEGPRTTKAVHTQEFRTFGAMKVVGHECGWNGQCPPGTPWSVRFSNPIDVEHFDPAMVTVEPAIDNLHVEVWGDSMQVSGATKGRTKYTLTVSDRVADRFGQRLAKPATLDFRVTDAPESLWAQGNGMVVLDPAAGPRFSVFSVNQRELRVRAFAVTPADLPAYWKMIEALGRDSRDLKAPGKKVIDTELRPTRDPDAIVETAVDLSPALRGGLGHVVVVIEPTKAPKEPWMQQRVVAWVQSTRIGLSAHVDDASMLVWASALQDGAPLADVAIELQSTKLTAATGKDGLATLPLPTTATPMIVARRGDDVALLPENIWWWQADGSWKQQRREPQLHWYVFDDRHLYRPGETVHVKGWLRVLDPGKQGDLRGVDGSVREVSFTLTDAVGNEVRKGTLKLNAHGAFDTAFELPKTMNTGGASLRLFASGKLESREYWHGFDVQEFRRPEYEVTARLDEGPHVVGTHTVATVAAKYYAGGPLPGAQVQWNVTSSPGHYQPPGHDGFTFGTVIPWWCFWRGWGGWRPDPAEQPKTVAFAAQTNGGGEHRLRMDFDAITPARPMQLTAEATVTDVNRQAWSGSTSTVVHPSQVYVGVRTDRAFVQQGESIELDLIAVDIDGKPVVGVPIDVHAARLDWQQRRGESVEVEVDPQTCTRKAEATAVRCSIPVAKGGSWRLVATTKDAKGRSNRTQIELWVAGGDLPAPRDVSQEQVLLIPDREQYAAGDTAKIAVSAPWPGAQGLVTLRRAGLLEARRVTLDGTATVIEVPIDAAWAPGVTVQVDLVGAAVRRGDDGKPSPKLAKRVAFASGNVSLSIPPRQRTLAVAVSPAVAKIGPGGKTEVRVEVQDSAGKPVADAEVALVVVDESVLALGGYRLEDPLASFYRGRDPGVRDHYLRAQVLLASTADVRVQGNGAPGGGGSVGVIGRGARMAEAADAAMPAAPPAEPSPTTTAVVSKQSPAPGPAIAMRSNFDALALFSASVATDTQGRANVPLTLPDNLTRYRIMAVAVAGDRHFGAGESSITARLPLMVRPSAPRFLNFGDELELPVVVQNQTDAPLQVDVAVRARNAELTKGQGRRIEVPANDRVEVRFPTKAAFAGTARFQFAAATPRGKGEGFADAAELALPVWTPATTEAFATYGELDGGAVLQPVAAPPGVFPQFGGLEISTTSTAVAALTDAVLYLVTYPFECSEQIATRVLAIASLKDVLTAFHAEGLPDAATLVAAVKQDLTRLAQLQTDDGGFSFWGRGWPSWPFLSVHVTHTLERARLGGFTVPSKMLTAAREYVADIERHLPSDYPVEVRRTIRAYALYVLELGGKPDVAKAMKLIDEVGADKLPLEAIAWLLPTVAGDPGRSKTQATMMRALENAVSETAADAHFTTHYTDGDHLLLHSDRRVDALVLEALIRTAPKHDLIPKLVRGLLDHRVAGRWSSTQENGFVLVALDRYFDTFESATPDFVAKAWLGPRFAGQHTFHGRSTETSQIDVPMAWLQDPKHASADLTLQKSGPGRLYYRVGMRYAPRDLTLPPFDAGFAVQRVYEAVDDPGDVRRDADGSWHIKAGARVRVRVTMVNEARRYHVALVDPMPAGFEIVNPAFAASGALPTDPKDEGGGGWWWWARTWYEHQNLRDERAEAFSSLLWEGVHDYDYVARATTPGRFVVPPAKAEEMYHPEVFGRGAGDRVIIE